METQVTLCGRVYPLRPEAAIPPHIKVAALLLGGKVRKVVGRRQDDSLSTYDPQPSHYAKEVISLGGFTLQHTSVPRSSPYVGCHWLVTGEDWVFDDLFHTAEEALAYVLDSMEEHGHD